MWRVALIVLPLGVLGNLAVTLLATDRALLATLGQLPRLYLGLALLLTLTPWVTAALRLLIWSRFLHYHLPLVTLLRTTLVIDLGSAASPTAIGGEAFKWGMLVQHGVRPGAAAALALIPKLEDAAFFALAVPCAILYTRSWRLLGRLLDGSAPGGRLVAALLVALLLVLAALLLTRLRWWSRGKRWLRRTALEMGAVLRLIVRRGKSRFALTLTLTAVQWVARYSVVSAVFLFLRVPVDPVLAWLLQWVVFTIMSFVPTPGATGGAEVAFSAVHATVLPAGALGIATAVWRVFTFYIPIALAGLLFLLLGFRREPPRPSPAQRPAPG